LGQRWHDELRPNAVGYLGNTEGITEDGRFVVAARFESADAARQNSARPEQDSWWSDMSKVVTDVDVHDCSQVITMLGGGSDDAGFVQVMVGRIKDRAKFDALNARTLRTTMVLSYLGTCGVTLPLQGCSPSGLLVSAPAGCDHALLASAAEIASRVGLGGESQPWMQSREGKAHER
jgi:Asp-tRNA(Asn)/Glu-tRNA(Gln) amidotransferase A subunit family amidase